MLRLYKPILLLMLSSLFFLAAIPAYADGISNPMYSVTGMITLMTGTNACTPAPCTEAINFAFDLGYQLVSDPSYGNAYYAYVVNATAIWSGDLGTFTQSFSGPAFFTNVYPLPGACNVNANYLGFFDPGGNEVDISVCDNAVSTPVVPSFSAQLYNCNTQTCIDDFASPYIGPGVAVLGYATVEATVRQVPESPTFILLASGMLVLGLGRAVSRKLQYTCDHRS